MIVWTLVTALAALAFLMGWGAAVEMMAREIRKGVVEVDGKRYVCYVSALPPKHNKHKH